MKHEVNLRSLAFALLVAVMASGARPVAGAQQAELPWWQRAEEQRIGHYLIRTDAEPALANDLARHLNLMYGEYTQRLASLPQRTPEKLNVLIFARQQDYLHVMRLRFGVDARGTAGIFFVNQLGTALAFWTEGLPRRRIEHVLQHEGFHQFAWSRFGNDLPIWVNEGLAEFFGAAVMIDGRMVLGQSPPRVVDAVAEAIELERHIPFNTMLGMSSAQWSDSVRNGDAALLYQQSWSMVNFLVYGDDGRYVQAFETYLRLLNAAVRSEEAFARAFGPEIAAFERRWKLAAQQARPGAFVTALERIEFLAEGALELARRRIAPESLDELRRQLQAIGFSYGLHHHGLDITLKAEDASLYGIPEDDLSRQPPHFVVEKPSPAKLSPRERYLEQQHPAPPLLRTEHLRPRELEVRWTRDKKSGAVVGYEILVR